MRRLSRSNDTSAGEDTASASAELRRVLDQPPRLAETSLRDDTLLTQRWRHGALHGFLPVLRSHVVVTYYGDAQDMRLNAGDARYRGKTRPGTLTLIPMGQEGQWDIAGEIEVSHVYLPHRRIAAGVEQLTGGKSFELLGRVGFDDPTGARILEMLSREASSPDPSSSLFLEHTIDLLCLQLVRGHSSLSALSEPQVTRGLTAGQVKRVTDYMREHLAEEVGLDELAGLLDLSRFYFCTAFRLATGKTPHEWLRGERIALSRKLLAEPYLSITDVGLAVGYGTPSAFTAAFRKLVSQTPTEFRRAL